MSSQNSYRIMLKSSLFFLIHLSDRNVCSPLECNAIYHVELLTTFFFPEPPLLKRDLHIVLPLTYHNPTIQSFKSYLTSSNTLNKNLLSTASDNLQQCLIAAFHCTRIEKSYLKSHLYVTTSSLKSVVLKMYSQNKAFPG